MSGGEDEADFFPYLRTVVDRRRPVAVVQLDIGQRPCFGRPTGSDLDATLLDAIFAFFEPLHEHS